MQSHAHFVADQRPWTQPPYGSTQEEEEEDDDDDDDVDVDDDAVGWACDAAGIIDAMYGRTTMPEDATTRRNFMLYMMLPLGRPTRR
jgi:hypothetical protein